MGKTSFALLCVAALALLASPAALAGSFAKTVPFELGKWIDVDVTDGPVTLHRIRLVEQTGQITKSKIFRPTGSEYLRTVQIQLDYSNSATKDWQSFIQYEWFDAENTLIDGYKDSEDLSDREVHDLATVTLSTLKYGIDKAKTVRIKIDFGP